MDEERRAVQDHPQQNVKWWTQTLMRAHPEFRAHCGRAFTQYEAIRHLRGKFKPVTEATCQVDYAGTWMK